MPHSVAPSPAASSRAAFTLIELMTSVAAMVIVAGVMVQMARDVRGRNADTLTRRLLSQLDQEVSRHPEMQASLAGLPQLVQAGDGNYDESAIRQAAIENNREFVKLWLQGEEGAMLREQPLSVFDEKAGLLRDAWGTPIVFMPAGAPNIRIAPQSRFFLMSAGPDRMFTTVLDNLYSYEGPGAMADTR